MRTLEKVKFNGRREDECLQKNKEAALSAVKLK